MRRWGVVVGALAGLLLLGAARPALADDWTADDHEVTGTPATFGTGSGAGGGGYQGSAIAQAYSEKHTDGGNVTGGGVSYTVTRSYTKNGSPGNATVTLSLSVVGSTTATGLYGFSGAYGMARSTASAPGDFPGSTGLDEDAYSAYPVGPASDSYNVNNSGGSGITKTLTASITLEGTIYANTEAWASNQHATANAESTLTFSDPSW